MKRSLSVTLVVGCVSLLAACGNKPVSPVPPSSEGSMSSSTAPILEDRASIEAKAKAGDANAQFELGAMYHDGQEVEKDFAKAREWFTKAAAQNDSRAQFNLGVMEYTGEGVQQSFAKAQEWFEKSASQGNSRAEFNLGVMQYRAEGMKQDLAAALDNFTKAGSMGFSEAQFNLGVMLAKGEGTAVDIPQAYAWFEAARSFGSPKAAEILNQIEAELSPDELKLATSIAEKLKKEINARVSAAIATGETF